MILVLIILAVAVLVTALMFATIIINGHLDRKATMADVQVLLNMQGVI